MSSQLTTKLVDEKIRESVFFKTVNNGIDVYVHPKPKSHRQHALLCVEYGSIDTLEGISIPTGVAHFLEHRLFDKNGSDISERFASLGADIDAQTSFTQTKFTVTTTNNLDCCIDLLWELISDLHLYEEGIERERQIIGREIELFDDNVEWVCFSNALRALYPNHPISTDIAGDISSLKKIDASTLEKCHGAFYCRERLSMFISGNVDEHTFLEKISSTSLDSFLPGSAEECALVRESPIVQFSRVSSKLAIVRSRIYIAFSDVECGLTGLELIKKEICLELFADMLFGPSSMFFNKHYETGEIDGENFGWETYAEPAFVFSVLGGNVGDSERFEQSVRDELIRVSEVGFSDLDFQRSRRKMFGRILGWYEDTESCAAMNHSAISRCAAPFDFTEALQQTTIQDVEKCLFTCFNVENFGVGIVEPVRRAPWVGSITR